MKAAPKAPCGPEDAIIEELRDFLTRRYDANLTDTRRTMAPHILIELGRRGVAGLMVPKERHGCGLSFGQALRVIRFISTIDLSVGLAVGLHNFLGLRSLLLYGSRRARADLAEEVARGMRLCAFALTEPHAGSDPRRITTKASRQADGSWILNGSKRWTGLGAWCGAVVTFAQAYDEDDRPVGVTGFVFPSESVGLRIGAEAMTMGLRGVFQGALHFDNLRVNQHGVLGKPGEGMALVNHIVGGGRLGCVAFASGAMHRCVQVAGRYVATRKIGTGAMSDNGSVGDAFAKIMAKTVVIDLLFDWLCAEVDKPDPLPDEICCAAKIIAPEWAFQVADGCMQLMGGRGYEENNVVARVFRDVRVIRIFEGPTETILYHLGGLVTRPDSELKKLLSDRLNAPDIFQVVVGEVGRARTHNHELPRADQHRLLSWLGEIVAHGLLWAVVRKAGVENPAARIAETYFRRALEVPMPERPWASAAEIEQLHATCEGATGDIQPHQPGENWILDSELSQAAEFRQ